ncbi:response regulator [Thauera linaloolentis]|uniref:Response regulator n=1 Tax=Thauera linaloolentis (strain DSM 12138 / JCM 21573 / CCUG 41526 / CIP 105981 / IAM 15112 / NBRC 102519 / 47Lol) TaxID=1123367 RepID=N6YTI3_THAL4|nr:HD domain-containing phosphohydrolase [Thauera linaloolentis]ENO85702.1 response regulator [Thauera linaloolentis 47Lol = DSM 12138]MCM8566675.1 response regulator [Thauera linaloolentis]
MKRLKDPRRTLLLVDDEPSNLQVLRHTLQDDYRLLFAKDGLTALELVRTDRPELILLDIMMPGISGYEVCKVLKRDPGTAAIPVIFVTALVEAANERQGLELGAVDYISKPFNPHIVQARVRTHLSLVQTAEVLETRLQIVQCLGAAAEYKDNETGLHVIRMSHYARILALAVGYSEAAADDLLHAAPMHDVGKIGIPDAILRKPGALTAEEWTIMRQHTVIGARIIGNHPSGLLRMAATIALNHHEKWDGSGYPNGLAGENIPHVARVIAIADVFDALTSVRPYKPAWPVDDALALISRESGKHFDPELVDALGGCLAEMLQIREQWADAEDDTRGPIAALP